MRYQKFLVGLSMLVSIVGFAEETKPPTRLPKKETTNASPKTQRTPIDSSKTVKIVYGSPAWNKSPAQIDSAFLIVRDSDTKRTAKIVLDESEPDSNVFTGNFSVNFGGPDSVKPEVYIPPIEVSGDYKSLQKFNRQIEAGQASRKPLLFHKAENGQQVIDVYDTKDQAKAAFAAYQAALVAKQEKKSKVKPIPDQSALEAARLAEKQRELERLAKEAAAREAERVRMDQIAKAEIERRKREVAQMAEAEKKRRREEAKRWAEKGLSDYAQGKFKDAEIDFSKANEFDPENNSYYYKYGVSLYRNDKFNEAVVYLKIAKVEPAAEPERIYFLGLCHYRLKELDAALESFGKVKSSGNAALAPSAGFYEGVLRFGLEKYDEAKQSFEFVIDNSQDPRMDQQAEEYIEKIAHIQAFLKAKENPNTITLTLGLQQDSNILLAPDGQESQGSTTNIAGLRYLAALGYERRIIYTEKHELSAKLDVVDMISADTNAHRADPLSEAVSLPYSFKGMALGKGYKLSITPTYSKLYMDPNNTGTEDILDSTGLEISNTFVMSERWFAAYVVSGGSDKSLLTVTDEADNTSSSKVALKTSQTFLIDDAKKKGVIANLGLTSNNAIGENKDYSRMDLGVTYTAPWASIDASWTAGLAFYSLTYPTPNRKDTNAALNLALSKNFTESWSSALTGNYTKNTSTDDANTYSKYTIMLTGTYKGLF